MLSKTKAFIAKHRKAAIAATAAVGLVAVGISGTTALLGGREDIATGTGQTGNYSIGSGDDTQNMSARLFPGSSDSQTLSVKNDGVFGSVYGLEVTRDDGATVDPSIFADIDATLTGALSWSGSFADLETLTVVDTTGIAPAGQSATVESTTLTLSVPADETNPAFGEAGQFTYKVTLVHNQNNGSGSPELLTGLTGTGETKVKAKS